MKKIVKHIPSEHELLMNLDRKLDTVLYAMADAKKQAAISGAVAGSISGSITGSIVTLGIAYIKAKFGI